MVRLMTDDEAMLPENVEFRDNGGEMASTALHNMIVDARHRSDGSDSSAIALVAFATACIVQAVATRMRGLGADEQCVAKFGEGLMAAVEHSEPPY